MRHQRAGLHLSRTSAHRQALFSNLVAALFTYERIKTTDAKAKETRRLAERTITWARRLGDVLTKDPDKRSDEEKGRVVHAVRMARRVVRDRSAVGKLFDEIGPRFLGRHGGYTRIVKVGQRPGDAAPMSILELIPDGAAAGSSESSGAEPHEDASEAKAKGAGGGAGGKGAKGGGEQAAAKAKSRAAGKGGKPKSKPKAEPKSKASGSSGSSGSAGGKSNKSSKSGKPASKPSGKKGK